MKSTDSENDSFLKWGLNRNVTPCFGARLVQEGNRLHYLADRASITGKFSEAECLKLDVAFPHFISQMESMLTTGEMNPRHAHCVTYTTMVSPAKPIPLAVAATYTSPFTPPIVNYFHKSKYENSTCNKSAGGEAMSVARGCLANAACTPAGTTLWPDTQRHAIQ